MLSYAYAILSELSSPADEDDLSSGPGSERHRVDGGANVDLQQIFSDDQRARIVFARQRNQIFGLGAAEEQKMIVNGQAWG